jgi:hypothetical protein
MQGEDVLETRRHHFLMSIVSMRPAAMSVVVRKSVVLAAVHRYPQLSELTNHSRNSRGVRESEVGRTKVPLCSLKGGLASRTSNLGEGSTKDPAASRSRS